MVELGEFMARDFAFRVRLAIHFVAFISGMNISKLAAAEHRSVGNVIGVVAVREFLHHGSIANHSFLSSAGVAGHSAIAAAFAASHSASATAYAASERTSAIAAGAYSASLAAATATRQSLAYGHKFGDVSAITSFLTRTAYPS